MSDTLKFVAGMLCGGAVFDNRVSPLVAFAVWLLGIALYFVAVYVGRWRQLLAEEAARERR